MKNEKNDDRKAGFQLPSYQGSWCHKRPDKQAEPQHFEYEILKTTNIIHPIYFTVLSPGLLSL